MDKVAWCELMEVFPDDMTEFHLFAAHSNPQSHSHCKHKLLFPECASITSAGMTPVTGTTAGTALYPIYCNYNPLRMNTL